MVVNESDFTGVFLMAFAFGVIVKLKGGIKEAIKYIIYGEEE